MQLALSTLLLAHLIGQGNAYIPLTPFRQHSISSSRFLSSQTSDAAFSAFAESLEEDAEAESSAEDSRSGAASPVTWQAKLEDLLDPQTNQAERQILLSELLNSNEEIRNSVMDALASRKIDPLLTPTAARLQDGTRAVVRQIANDILPQLSKSAAAATSGSSSSSPPFLPFPLPPPTPANMEKVAGRFFDLVSSQLQTTARDIQDDLADPINKIPQRITKQTEDLVQEARNIFLETPEGLEEPPYTVVESCDLYEIRDYEGYKVASTAMAQGEDLATAGNAFNTLASYLFGENQDSKAMAMTTPVSTTNLGEMRFYLAEPVVPLPNDAAPVEIIDVPAARLAVRKFTGFATDGEVARQKDTLLQALEMDGVELDVAHGAVVPHVVFEYNPPYTLPIVRRNEIAIPVSRATEEAPVTSLKEEWIIPEDEDEEMEDDIAPSDV